MIGNGTGAWDVPVGGMGALTDELVRCAAGAGAELVTGAEVTAIEADGRRAEVRFDGAGSVTLRRRRRRLRARRARPAARRAGRRPTAGGRAAEGQHAAVAAAAAARRAPSPPEDAFAGTFHVNETYDAARARRSTQAQAGHVPAPVPCEIYCHSLTDPSILGPGLAGPHADAVRAPHARAAVRARPRGAHARGARRHAARRSTRCSPSRSRTACCARRTAAPCLEAKTPLDLDDELALPRGNIFHRDLAWPFAEDDDEAGAWGTETAIANVHLGGAGARRGGGVSGIPGRNAAMAILALGG